MNFQYRQLDGYGILRDPQDNPYYGLPPVEKQSSSSNPDPGGSSSTQPQNLRSQAKIDYDINARVYSLTNTQTDDLYRKIFNREPIGAYGKRKNEIEFYLKAEQGYDPDSHKYKIGGLGMKKGRGLSSDYRDFGINKINHKKLDDGILTVRRKSNTNIPDMPSKRISRKLQKIIKHISGGGIPDYNDLNNLEDGEKDYLHKLISKSNMNERLSVPAPSKDQEEKDFHQFEVMKGEIMSGNDSKELVKKFKVLILKLSKQNVLPKNEVQELLEDLLSLGY